MLVLSRKVGESIVIGSGDDAVIVVFMEFKTGGQIKLGIEAPRDVPVWRSELLDDGGELKRKEGA